MCGRKAAVAVNCRLPNSPLKELQGWGIVKLVHVAGDKRDHFESMKDVWDMFRVVMDERKKREFDPTMRLLQECLAEAEKDKATDSYTEARIRELYKFFETTTAWYAHVRGGRLPQCSSS